MKLVKALMMKKLCINIVAVVCLLLFVQCSNRAKVNDDIEALKQQQKDAMEATQRNMGGLKEDIGNVAKQVRDATENHATLLNDLSSEVVQQRKDATEGRETLLEDLSDQIHRVQLRSKRIVKLLEPCYRYAGFCLSKRRRNLAIEKSIIEVDTVKDARLKAGELILINCDLKDLDSIAYAHLVSRIYCPVPVPPISSVPPTIQSNDSGSSSLSGMDGET